MAPTRELAIQTHDNLSVLGTSWGIASVAIFGGVSKEGQVKMLKASMKKGKDGLMTRIVVGTPGRILDLMQDGALDLSGVDYLVLDEADRMLDKGFENDIRRIIGACKPLEERQTMMCEPSLFYFVLSADTHPQPQLAQHGQKLFDVWRAPSRETLYE